jgi:RNA polymerase sigma factor (sigma-70 family)
MEGPSDKTRTAESDRQDPQRALIESGKDYEKYRPLLFSALARLAQQGYPAPPSEGLDLIHDFFLEAWTGLRQRYEPSKANFATYTFAAFVRFARPRIVRSIRWRQNLYAPDELAELAEHHGRGLLVPEFYLDLETVRRALDRMTKEDRRILKTTLTAGLTQREAARRLNTSRYHLRQKSADALARLASAIKEPEAHRKQDWRIARALWLEDKDLTAVARGLNLTPSQIRNMRRRLLATVASAVSDERTEPDQEAQMDTKLCSLWKQFVKDPKDPKILSELRRPSRTAEVSLHPKEASLMDVPVPTLGEELLDHIEDCDTCLSATESTRDPASLYSALASLEDEVSPQDLQIREELIRARADDDSAVERAIVDALLPSLSARLAKRWDETDVAPLTIFRSINAVSMLAEDVIRAQPSPTLLELTSKADLRSGDKPVMAREVVLGEIREVAKVSNDLSAELFQWVFSAAQERSTLFPSLNVTSSDTYVIRLALAQRSAAADLFERWKPQRSAVAETY